MRNEKTGIFATEKQLKEVTAKVGYIIEKNNKTLEIVVYDKPLAKAGFKLFIEYLEGKYGEDMIVRRATNEELKSLVVFGEGIAAWKGQEAI